LAVVQNSNIKIDAPGMALRRANARPMTGSAKQSILPLRGEMDCFAALAMTAKHTDV